VTSLASPASGALRLARAALGAGTCVLFALVGHLAGGGRAPSVPVVVVTTAFASAVCLALAGRQRRFPELFLALCVGQLGAHVAFSVDGRHGALMPGGAIDLSVSRSLSPPAATSQHGMLSVITSPAMALGHLAAAAAAAILLAYGERALWAAFRLLLRVMLARVSAAPVTPRHTGPVWLTASDRVWYVGLVVSRWTSRRGPPAAVATV
jgi:hypothetical protein